MRYRTGSAGPYAGAVASLAVEPSRTGRGPARHRSDAVRGPRSAADPDGHDRRRQRLTRRNSRGAVTTNAMTAVQNRRTTVTPGSHGHTTSATSVQNRTAIAIGGNQDQTNR